MNCFRDWGDYVKILGLTGLMAGLQMEEGTPVTDNPRPTRAHRTSPPDPMLPGADETPETVDSSIERMSNEGGVATEIPHDTQEYKVVDGKVEPE
jgi:hypothetical protein